MALAFFVALALFQAPPPPPLAPRAGGDGPVSTAQRVGDGLLSSAPSGDYEFTAWCYGALSRHMEIYDMVEPELRAIGKRLNSEDADMKGYGDQLDAGYRTLAQYRAAVEAAESVATRPINVQGAAALEQGRQVWARINTVDKSSQAYSWMSWELPDRCGETAARLETRSKTLARMITPTTSSAPRLSALPPAMPVRPRPTTPSAAPAPAAADSASANPAAAAGLRR